MLLPRVLVGALLVPADALVGGRRTPTPGRAPAVVVVPADRVLEVIVVVPLEDELPVLPALFVVVAAPPAVDRLRAVLVAVPLAGRAVGLKPLDPLDVFRVPSVVLAASDDEPDATRLAGTMGDDGVLRLPPSVPNEGIPVLVPTGEVMICRPGRVSGIGACLRCWQT